MTRITSTLLIALILFNGSIAVMEGSGLADDIGVELAPGVDSNVDEAIAEAKEGFQPGTGIGDTLFALFATGMSTFSALINGVFALPQMFLNLGFPSWIVFPLFAPMYAIATFELIYMATGRNTV